MDLLSFFLPAILMIICLVGIHCYLGIHVLKREVIFIDLSLAQLAALGYAVAGVLQFEINSTAAYFIALSFTFLGAILFAFGKRAKTIVSQESLIGITYALGSSIVLLILNNSPHGSEHLKELLVGRLLWVTGFDVAKMFIIYCLVGIIHFVFREKFLKLSGGEKINNSFYWDFLFYALFGIVITSSVGNAGILLVFSLLIGPAVISKCYKSTIKDQLFLGWIIGVIFCVIGLVMSYKLDTPVGATIVALIAALTVLQTIYVSIKSGARI